MIFKFVFVSALIAGPALGLAIKDHSAREEASKGGRQLLAPVVQQRLVVEQTKSIPKLEHVVEQQREELPQQAPLVETKQEELPTIRQKQEEPSRVEESKEPAQRYDARPQVVREELAKGQKELAKTIKYEQQQQGELSSKSKYEQKQEELPSKTKYEQKQEERSEISKIGYEQKQEVVTIEQNELSKTRYEQKQEEQIEQQQREYDNQQIELKEEQRNYEEQQPILIQQQQVYQQATKGGEVLAQPLAEAEPYAFSYQVEGSSRSESGDTKGTVRGQYTLQGADGSRRVVDYVADHNGFRALVDTNEFGTESKSPANIALRTSQPLAEEITLRLGGKTREDFAAPAVANVKGATLMPAKPDNWQVKGVQAPLPLAQVQEQVEDKKKIVHDELHVRPPALTSSPAKGERLVQEEPQRQQQELLPSPQLHEPVKNAELRAPRAISGELKLGQTRSGFESATAHRIYRAQPSTYVAPVAPVVSPVRPVVPAVLVRAHPPSVRQLVPANSRTYLQRERYPPSPVHQAGYRRSHYTGHVEQPVVQTNPRVSFYAPAAAPAPVSSSISFDDDHPSSFEQPDSLEQE